MDAQTLTALLSTDALTALDALEYRRADEFALSAKLRSQGFAPEVTAAILTQAQLRGEAEAKFGPFAAHMLFTRDGLAQATRLPVAAHHAGRMQAAGVEHIADLGCGIGADALAFAGVGLQVSAVDIDEVTAALAAYNLQFVSGAEVTHGAAEDFDLSSVDGVWLDPARRAGTKRTGEARRLADPEAFSPSLTWAVSAAEQVKAAGIKLGPALDHTLIPAGWEAQWVSHAGDVVEVALYAGDAVQNPGRGALIMRSGGAMQVFERDLPDADEDGIGTLGEYLFEPDGAVVRAGLVTALCAPLAAHRVSPAIAYLTGDQPAAGAAAHAVRQYRVHEVLPARVKPLRQELIRRGIGSVVIKKRGMDIVPEQMRRQLKLPAGEKATLIFTRLGEDRVCLLTQPVT